MRKNPQTSERWQILEPGKFRCSFARDASCGLIRCTIFTHDVCPSVQKLSTKVQFGLRSESPEEFCSGLKKKSIFSQVQNMMVLNELRQWINPPVNPIVHVVSNLLSLKPTMR